MKRARFSQGSVLIVTMWASIGLVSVALLFGHAMLMNYRGSDNDLAGRQADQAIEGAARYAVNVLSNASAPGLLPDSTSYNSEAQSVGEASFWFIGRPTDDSTYTTSEFGLVDEAGKLNLNTATKNVLRLLPGMTEDLAAAIVEWRTPGSTSGATASGGVSATTYTIKHAPFESIDELAMVTGMTSEILYGEDTNMNGVLDSNENDGDESEPPDNADGKLDPGILEYVTVFSRESTTRSDGSKRINVRTVSDEFRTLLTNTFDVNRANQIIASLGGTPSTSLLQMFTRSGMTEAEFDQIYDGITTSDGDSVAGLVNVNTASESVLACIPGIGVTKAQTIVATRRSRTSTKPTLAWVAKILTGQSSSSYEFLTGRTSQVCADVAAVGRNGRGYRRTRFVIDASGEAPKIVYRRNLAGLGWALGEQVRADLATYNSLR